MRNFKFGKRHAKRCGCIDCIRSNRYNLRGKLDDPMLSFIIKRYKKLIIKNLRFEIQSRGRFEGKLLLSKEFRGEEWIMLNSYEHHLIKCCKCKLIARAPITSRRNCVDCIASKHESTSYCDWTMWGRTA